MIQSTSSKNELKEVAKVEQPIPKKKIPKESVLNKLVKPHMKKSRLVTEKDIERVSKDSKILYELCFEPLGLYQGAFAMHHSQIDNKDPLNFFVMWDRRLIINPMVIKHSAYFTDSKEACKSFPENQQVIVKRWRKMQVRFVTLMVDPKDKDKFTFSSPLIVDVSGKDSFIFQHEIDHSEAKFIYPII